jgi:hypothetical protein
MIMRSAIRASGSLRTVLTLAAALTVLAVLGLTAAALGDAAQGAQAGMSDRARIVGTYRLIDSQSNVNGKWVRTPGFAPNATYGYLTYSETGHVAEYTITNRPPAAQGQGQGRGPAPAGAQGQGRGQAPGQGQGQGRGIAPDVALSVLQGMTAYYGTFRVDDKSKSVLIHYDGNMVPHAPDGKYAYEFDGDRFTLTPGPPNGAGVSPGRVIWERMPNPPLSAEARKFVGHYRLLYTDTLREKGGKELDHENRSEARKGSAILYTPSGHMMAHLMNKDKRIKYAGAVATPQEAQQAYSSYNGYFGRFTTFENFKPVFVLHNQQGTAPAGGRGSDFTKRFYQFTGNVLRLGTPPTTNAEGITSYSHLYWERLPAVK